MTASALAIGGCQGGGQRDPGAALAGTWSYEGEGWKAAGSAEAHPLKLRYTLLRLGAYVLEYQDLKNETREVMQGKWEVQDDTLVLLQEHASFFTKTGSIEKSNIEVKRVKFDLAPGGDALTLQREDGNCPGSQCVRTYKRER